MGSFFPVDRLRGIETFGPFYALWSMEAPVGFTVLQPPDHIDVKVRQFGVTAFLWKSDKLYGC